MATQSRPPLQAFFYFQKIMQTEHPSYYAILTAHVRYSTKISSLAKLFYAEITALSMKEGYCFASNAYFADNYSCSVDTVTRCIKELESAGFIRVEVNANLGNRRHIWAIDTKTELSAKVQEPIRKNADTYPQKYGEGIRKNADNNSIYNNTINSTSNKQKEVSASAQSFESKISVVKKNFTTQSDTDSNFDVEEKKEKKEPSIGRGAVTTEMPKVIEVVDHMNNVGSTKFRANTGNTAKMILARFKEGYTMDDFKKVIDTRFRAWNGTDMMQHFCPQTLFRPNNFEKYLQNAKFAKSKASAGIGEGSDYSKWDESKKPF
jgi:uncharacterized phage protein (TIGR02220 family)